MPNELHFQKEIIKLSQLPSDKHPISLDIPKHFIDYSSGEIDISLFASWLSQGFDKALSIGYVSR